MKKKRIGKMNLTMQSLVSHWANHNVSASQAAVSQHDRQSSGGQKKKKKTLNEEEFKC